MRLLPLEPAAIRLAAGWLACKENSQWLEFGHGVELVTPETLALMNRRGLHQLRVYTPDEGDMPIGLVVLSDISAVHKTATLWYVLGDKHFGGRSYTTRAVAGMLTLGFEELGLRSVHAWAVEANAPSIAVLQRNGFKPVGRLRECHAIDGGLYDRLLFDVLRSEHVPPREWQVSRTVA